MRRYQSDLRDAVRALRARPGFTTAVVLTLALAIGANAAIFSAVDALLIKPLPFADADRLVRLQSERGGQPGSLSYREVQDLRELRDVFVDVAAYTDQGQYNASGFGRPEELSATITTANLFSVMGVPLHVGNVWPDVLDRSRDFKLVISYGLWQRRFGGAHDIVGKRMALDGADGYEILGVAPRGFAFPLRSDLYRSHGIAAAASAYENRALRGRWGIGRLRDGVTIEQAQARLADLARRLAQEFPSSNTGIGFRITPLRAMYVGEARPFLWLLLAAVGLVLIIACCNVANLMLARALSREREIAVRAAIGATRRDILRALLAESALLGAAAGVVGLLFALAGVQIISGLVRLDMPTWMSIELSWRVFTFAGVVSIGAGIAAGLIPAWRAARHDLAGVLKDGARGSGEGAGRARLRSALVVSQTAFAVVLLVGAGLLVRSFQAITSVDPGFDPDSVLAFRVELGWRAYPDQASSARFEREMLRRLAELPEARSVGSVDNLPLDGRPTVDGAIMLEGQSAEEQQGNPFVNRRTASPGFFTTLRVPVLSGRVFAEHDRDSTNRVVVVSKSLAARMWPGQDALGKRLQLSSSDFRVLQADSARNPWLTVIGVVGDVRHHGLTSAPALDAYLHFEQWQGRSLYFLVRTAGDPLALAHRAPELVYGIDPNQSYFDVRTLRDRVDDRTWVPRMSGALFTAFGALATTLAVIGIYAVLAFGIAQRRQELSVRQALGASPFALARLVVRDGMRLALIGAATGLAGGFMLARAMPRLLFSITPADGVTYAGVALLVLGAALVACAVPARRVTRIAPLDAMRGTP